MTMRSWSSTTAAATRRGVWRKRRPLGDLASASFRTAKNRGYGAALRTGFQAATKPWIGFSDADCQFDLRELKRLTLLLQDGDIACGYRIDRQDNWLRILYSRVYNVLVGTLLGTGVRDCDCALKLFRRETMRTVMHETDGFLVNAEMLTKARLQNKKVIEVGVHTGLGHEARVRYRCGIRFRFSSPCCSSGGRRCCFPVRKLMHHPEQAVLPTGPRGDSSRPPLFCRCWPCG